MNTVKAYFTDHPSRNEVFETSDGYLFHEDGDAGLHAKSLKNKEVTMHKRDTEMEAADGVKTEPVISEIQQHAVPGGEENTGAVIPAESIQLPVTVDVQDKINVAQKATGEPVTSTAGVTNTPGENHMPQQVNGVPVNTASGEAIANATPVADKKTSKK